jgi:hypothetical protein
MDIAKVLQKIRPNSVWSLNNNDYQKLLWRSEDEKPSLKEIKNAWKEIETDLEVERLSNLRKKAYQEESDPLFFEYQRGDIEKSEWIAKVEEIKARFPFPASSQT